MFRDPDLLPLVAREGGAAAAHLSVAEDLGRRLQHRRGSLFARHSAARRRPSGAHADLRHRHQPADAAEGRSRRLRGRADRRLYRESSRPAGSSSLSDYYTAAYGRAVFDKSLSEHIVFSDHSLATDSVFAEVQLVSCRNVLIYFNRDLQDRAVGLFREALCRKGFLGIGSKESLRFSRSRAMRSTNSSREDRIFQKRDIVSATARRCRSASTRSSSAPPPAEWKRWRPAAGPARDAARAAYSSFCICRASGRACSRRSSRKVRPAGQGGRRQGAGGAGHRLFRPAGLSPAARRGTADSRCRSTSRCISRDPRSMCSSSPPRISTASACWASFLPARMRTAPRDLRPSTDAGGVTIVQEPDSAQVPLMVVSALKRSPADFVLSLDEIAALLKLCPSTELRPLLPRTADDRCCSGQMPARR